MIQDSAPASTMTGQEIIPPVLQPIFVMAGGTSMTVTVGMVDIMPPSKIVTA
jgi:hypothetical protein